MNYYDILTIQIFTIIGWKIGDYIYFKLTTYKFINEKYNARLTTTNLTSKFEKDLIERGFKKLKWYQWWRK